MLTTAKEHPTKVLCATCHLSYRAVTNCEGESPMNVVRSTCWFNAHIPMFKIPRMWDNSHDVNKMHHAFKYQQCQVCWVKAFLMALKEIPWTMELSATITVLPSVI